MLLLLLLMMMMICPGPFHNLHCPCSYERTFELALRMHELPVPYSGREGPWHDSSHRTNLLLSFCPYKFAKKTYGTVQSILKTWSTYQLKDCCAVVQSCHLYIVATVGVLFSSCQRHFDFSAVGNYNQTSF